MKLFFISVFLGALTLPFHVFALSSFVFTSADQLEPGTRNTITVQSQNAAGEKENIAQTACLEIETTSASGRFFSGTNSTESVSVLVLTMSKNSANRNFYYEDTQSGAYAFTLKAAYRPEGESRTCPNWPSEEWGSVWNASQAYTVGSGVGEVVVQSQSSSQTETPPPSGTATNWPVEQQVFVNAGPDRVALVGADVTFNGKALGIEKKPLENARYVWNFGDGTTKEGSAVAHAYRYPGEYIVVLDVSSGYFMGTDRARVQVEKSKILITSLGAEGGRFVELSNGSNYEIDISGWMLREGSVLFVIPQNSFIGAGKKVVFPYEVTSIPQGSNVELLYPNGSVADLYVPGRTVASVSKQTAPARNPAAPPLVVEKALLAPSVQAASAAVASREEDSDGSMPSVYKWLLAVLALAGVAGAGVVFLPKPASVSGVSGSALTPEDFNITEKTD